MRRIAVLILTLIVPVCLSAQNNHRQQGTIIRMRMTDCLGAQHGFMAAMSGAGKADAQEPFAPSMSWWPTELCMSLVAKVRIN